MGVEKVLDGWYGAGFSLLGMDALRDDLDKETDGTMRAVWRLVSVAAVMAAVCVAYEAANRWHWPTIEKKFLDFSQHCRRLPWRRTRKF